MENLYIKCIHKTRIYNYATIAIAMMKINNVLFQKFAPLRLLVYFWRETWVRIDSCHSVAICGVS